MLSQAALDVVVTLEVDVSGAGVPDLNGFRMVAFENGPEDAARQAYEAARRATIRCGSDGLDAAPSRPSRMTATFAVATGIVVTFE